MAYVSPRLPGGPRWIVCDETCAAATGIRVALWDRIATSRLPGRWWCVHCWSCGYRVVLGTNCLLCGGGGCPAPRFEVTLDGAVWAAHLVALGHNPIPEEMWEWADALFAVYGSGPEVHRITIVENPDLDVP